jgi:hypothetical protein
MRWWLIAVNVIGGVAVLGSYAHGQLTHPDTSGAVWGGVPASLKPWYIVSMLMAATGYFLFTYYVGCALEPERVRIGARFGFGAFAWLYALMLVASALWMPLTFAMIETPTAGLWVGIRTVLFLVAIGSLGILIAVASATPRAGDWSYWLAILGATAFCVQTVVLDAFVWPAYFRGF